MKIAVVGAGIAGITAAYLLDKRFEVTLIERNDYIGGHTNTIPVQEGDRTVWVDTGFIVCNPRTYPYFYQLLDEWGVSRRDSDMSFGYCCEKTGLGYIGPSVREFIRKPGNLLNWKLLGMIREQQRFGRRALADLEGDQLQGLMLADYLEKVGASHFFIDHYLIPIAAAVWSSPDADMKRFPAKTFLRFLANHGLLDLRHRPTWQTVSGGSHTYVKAFLSAFTGRVWRDSPVRAVRRVDDGITIDLENGKTGRFSHVVMATHADITLALLADATGDEATALSAWSYQNNDVVLHTDAGIMPTDRRIWASWNYHRFADTDPDQPLTMTYYMNRLQGLESETSYLVSLNARSRIDPNQVIYATEYTHPAYTEQSIQAQSSLREMNGDRHTYFCGSYMRYGFHEDAVVSAVEVARHFGIDL